MDVYNLFQRLMHTNGIHLKFCCVSLFIMKEVAQRYSVKKVFLKMSQNSQQNTCARVSFWEISKNTFQDTTGACLCYYWKKLFFILTVTPRKCQPEEHFQKIVKASSLIIDIISVFPLFFPEIQISLWPTHGFKSPR